MRPLFRRLWYLFQHRRFEANLREEMEFHREMVVRDLEARGADRERAGLSARRAFGSVALAHDQAKDVWLWPWCQDFFQDVRHARRTLCKNPAFSVVATLTLALGIGANTAIFSVVYGVILRPLPYRDPDRLITIEARRTLDGARTSYSFSDLADWQANAPSFETFAMSAPQVYALSGDYGAEMVPSAVVTSAFFSTLSGHFLLGRPLGLSDDLAPAVVISERLWRRRFNAAPTVLGRQITLSSVGLRRPYTIIGVADASFQFPSERTDLWTPAGYWVRELQPVAAQRGGYGFSPVARLRPGVTAEQARRDVDRASKAINGARLPAGEIVSATLVDLRDSLISTARPALLVLFVAVGLVLAVACANVANLLLARSAARSRELAVRRALGASRSRLVVQTLLETSLLVLAGATAGVLVAYGSVQTLVWLEPAGLPRLDSIRLDRPVLLFALAAAILTTMLSGLLPAVHASRTAPAGALKSATLRQSENESSRRARSLLVVVELAISVTLLVGAVLLGRSLANLLSVNNIGVRTEGVVAGELNLTMARTLTGAQQVALVDRLVEKIGTLPSVVSTGVGNGLPPNGARMRFVLTYPDPSDKHEREFQFDLVPITTGFFRSLNVPLRAGRYFSDADRAGSAPVMILSAGAARRLFGTADAVGRTLPSPKAAGERGDITIVGVVGDVKYSGIAAERRDAIYRPFPQYPFRNLFLVTRTTGGLDAAAETIRRTVADIDPEVTVTNMRPLSVLVGTAASLPRFRTAVLLALAGLASILALVGLYGVVSYSVAQRTREIGIRMALGATNVQVMQLVLGQSLSLIAIGLTLGLAAAAGATRVLQGLLFGLTPLDPATFVVVAVLFWVIATFASYVPARRATEVDPLVALRYE